MCVFSCSVRIHVDSLIIAAECTDFLAEPPAFPSLAIAGQQSYNVPGGLCEIYSGWKVDSVTDTRRAEGGKEGLQNLDEAKCDLSA